MDASFNTAPDAVFDFELLADEKELMAKLLLEDLLNEEGVGLLPKDANAAPKLKPLMMVCSSINPRRRRGE